VQSLSPARRRFLGGPATHLQSGPCPCPCAR
jgi:hypothetical protein